MAGSCCRRRGPRNNSNTLARGLGIIWAAAAGCVGTIAAGCVAAIDVETPPPDEVCIV